MSSTTLTLATWHLPVRTFARVIGSGDIMPQRTLEVTGPEEAFTVKASGDFDYARVDRPEMVTVRKMVGA